MKILLVDYRNERGQIVAQVLTSRSHTVTHSRHVNGAGGNDLNFWDDQAKRSCRNHLETVTPEVVLLHVGVEQRHWQECLRDIYQGQIVGCFTGRAIPDEVKADCAVNPKHCYYPGLWAFDYASEEECRRSPELGAILKFIDGVEEYLKQPKDSEEAKGILKKAKETLQQFNSGLETALNELTADLRNLLHLGQQPTEQQLKNLTDKRNRLIGSNP